MGLPTDDVIIRREGRAGRITLNRPKALNALTYPMVLEIEQALLAWRDDAQIAVVILDGAGERGLCAGGDVRSLYDRRTDGVGFAAQFWRDEYRVNAMIHRYDKPFVAIMDGIVMGGGIGLSAHAQGATRIVTETSKIAFPETTIGLIPDVGGTWLLSRAPAHAGTYLALVGAPMGAADAVYAGFADAFVPSARLPELIAKLCAGQTCPRAVIGEFSSDPGPSKLATELSGPIADIFGRDTIEDMRDALAALAALGDASLASLGRNSNVGDFNVADWAKATAEKP